MADGKSDLTKDDKVEMMAPDKKDPGANLTLTDPRKKLNGESWHLSWVYRGEGNSVRHGDNIFTIKPRLTVDGLNNLKNLIATQMECGTDELTITSMTKIPN